MQIQKTNSQQNPNFGASVVIKAKNGNFLNTLESLNSNWQRQDNPEHSYSSLTKGVGPDQDGWFRGLLANKAEAKVMHGFDALQLQEIKDGKTDPKLTLYSQHRTFNEYLASRSKEIEVKTLEDLLKLPMLKGYKKQIRAMFKAH